MAKSNNPSPPPTSPPADGTPAPPSPKPGDSSSAAVSPATGVVSEQPEPRRKRDESLKDEELDFLVSCNRKLKKFPAEARGRIVDWLYSRHRDPSSPLYVPPTT